MRGRFRRTTRTIDFEVEAEQPGHGPSAAALALVQPPTIPGAFIARVAALALLVGLAAAAWFGVVRPEIRDAAADRVDERLEQFQGMVDELVDDNDTFTPVTTIVGEAEADGTGRIRRDGRPG